MRLLGVSLVVASAAFADVDVKEEAMRSCKARLERARKELSKSDAAVGRARVAEENGALVLRVEHEGALRMVTVGPTSPRSSARNSWNPARDTWVDLPIIDKSYSTQKLNLFRFGKALEATITAYRGDDSPRAPPVPAWLRPFVDAFKAAVEECLR